MVQYRLKFVGRQLWREDAQRTCDLGARAHIADSFRFDARQHDDPASFFGFGLHIPAKLRRTEDHRRSRNTSEPRFYRGVGKACIDLTVEPFNEVFRGAPWHTDATP